MTMVLMLDGPEAGTVRNVHGNPPGRYLSIEQVRAPRPGDFMDSGEVRQVMYVPRKIMLFSRIMWVASCRDHGRRALEELTFGMLTSDLAKQAAGPVARYLCDHQASDLRCPHGCHGDAI